MLNHVYCIIASNIMIKMRCHCRPLECTCSSKFQVKLGDFDSAGTVPGLGITEPTDQLIKFASILPLGTPGYRAPEVHCSVNVIVDQMVTALYLCRSPCMLYYQDHMRPCILPQWTCGPLAASFSIFVLGKLLQ